MKQTANQLVYSREALIQQIEGGVGFEYLLFYGHKVPPDGGVTETCCSQWYPASFIVDDCLYLTAEHFMMAEKARLFDDAEMLQRILESKTPRDAKGLGRKVRNFDVATWAGASFEIVVRGSHAKFSQNRALGEWLLASAPKVLVEASPRDRIWGIGMGKANPNALDPRLWRGGNLLGFALMKARDSL
ncbi:MAG: NADAR family protein [Candidatus Obscuribacterales bacterium]